MTAPRRLAALRRALTLGVALGTLLPRFTSPIRRRGGPGDDDARGKARFA